MCVTKTAMRRRQQMRRDRCYRASGLASPASRKQGTASRGAKAAKTPMSFRK